MEIFETIKEIFRLSNPIVVGSWGIEYMVPLFETDDFEGGAEIFVNGMIHRGFVRITLNWLDLWDITLLNEDGTVKHLISGIYTDNLVMALDDVIERPLGSQVISQSSESEK